MSVIVSAKFDIYSSQNLLVKAGTRGTVTESVKPPLPVRYKVSFDTSPTPTEVWVGDDDIKFLEGTLGKARALIEGSTQVISNLSYPEFISNTEIIVGEELPTLRTRARIDLSDGLYILLTSNRVTGEIVFDIGYEA